MELLGKQDEHFKIPHYQRKYAWESVNCHVFLDDILEVANEKRKTHFFSNLTLSPLDKCGGYYVVDGQQRVATVSLFFEALRRAFADCSDLNLKLERCLKNGEFLKLSFEDQVDQRTYRHLLLDRFCEPESQNENMVENYRYFVREIERHKSVLRLAVDKGFLEKLLFVRVFLPEKIAPQRVFERMNGTKLSVTPIDLVKNFLLMQRRAASEQAIYDKLESNLWNWARYIHILVCMHAQQSVPYDGVYKEFKSLYRGWEGSVGGKTVDQFLEELKSWIQKFGEVSQVFNDLNGNEEIRATDLGRCGPLLMKIAIVFSTDDDQALRNKLIADIVEHLRSWIAVNRLDKMKRHPQRWDADLKSYPCLRRSKETYDKKDMEQAIVEWFPKIPEERIQASITAWVNDKANREEYYSTNASIIGILKMIKEKADTAW